MRFYTTQHRFYAGIDLHARTLALQNGDFGLAGQVASGCTEVRAPSPTPGQ